VHPLIDAVEDRAKAFGPALAKLAFTRGLAITLPDGAAQAIPISATPAIADQSEISQGTLFAAHLSSAALKMARYALSGPDADSLLSAMAPVERAMVEKTYASVEHLATTRVDYFVDRDGPAARMRALEINTTIPAMQGYSEIAARSLIEVLGKQSGLPPQEVSGLCVQNGSNALALFQALVAGFLAERGKAPTRIALLSRRNDAQLTELQYLARRFDDLGTRAEVVFPDQLSGDSDVRANGRKYDLVYRHLFVRRLEEIQSPFLVELFGEVPGRKAVVLNPPSAQMEVKITFALLSQAALEPALARAARLDEQELAAIGQTVPWTRVFRAGPTTDAHGQPVGDVIRWVSSNPEQFVLKRAWDYGGKAVFVGVAAGTEGFVQRVRSAYGVELDWPKLCERAARDTVGGGFVVQEFVHTSPEKHLVCSEDGVSAADWYVDFSCYASVGLQSAPAWGGVCRGSTSQIVNIVGGGGVLPLLAREVADQLASALNRSAPAHP